MQSVVLDCDNTLGMPARDVDDGLALLYLLGCPEVELLGVTTTFGNCIVDQSYAHTRALLAQADRDDIRVLRGAGQRGQAPTEAAHFLAEDEVNFATDVPAATCVLSAPCPLVVMNAEVCLQASFNWLDLVRLWAWDRSLDRALRNWLLAFGVWCGVPQC